MKEVATSPTVWLFLTAGLYTVILVGLGMWAARQRRREPPETTPATRRCPRCRGVLGVVSIEAGHGQLLSCEMGHRWEVRRTAAGAVLTAATPARQARPRLRVVR